MCFSQDCNGPRFCFPFDICRWPIRKKFYHQNMWVFFSIRQLRTLGKWTEFKPIHSTKCTRNSIGQWNAQRHGRCHDISWWTKPCEFRLRWLLTHRAYSANTGAYSRRWQCIMVCFYSYSYSYHTSRLPAAYCQGTSKHSQIEQYQAANWRGTSAA